MKIQPEFVNMISIFKDHFDYLMYFGKESVGELKHFKIIFRPGKNLI